MIGVICNNRSPTHAYEGKYLVSACYVEILYFGFITRNGATMKNVQPVLSKISTTSYYTRALNPDCMLFLNVELKLNAPRNCGRHKELHRELSKCSVHI